MQEVFRSIKGHGGLYEVSNLGRVKSLGNGKSTNPIWGKERLLKPDKDWQGYLSVILSKNGSRKAFKIARLVAITFIPNPKNLPQINHKNSIKGDNRVENLEWCDQRYNRNHFNRTRKTSSEYPGVYWRKDNQKWRSRIRINNQVKELGCFDDEIKAAEVYQKAVELVEQGG